MKKKLYLLLMMLVGCIASSWALCPECDEWHPNADFICDICGRIDDCHEDYWCVACRENCIAEEGVDCDICGEGTFCEDCVVECANNDTYMCADCVTVCEICGEYYCEACLSECQWCGSLVCDDTECYDACGGCGEKYCLECMGECPGGGFFCDDCFYQCESCNNGFCEEHIDECIVCNNPTCEDCLMECNCGNFICEDCFVDCNGCGEEGCFDCYLECDICGEYTCEECASECGLCGDWMCENCCAGECNCGNFVCEEYSGDCRECGDWYCYDCLGECAQCSEMYCENCFGECSYCGNGFCYDCLLETDHCEFVCDEHYFECAFCGDSWCLDCVFDCGGCSEVICVDCMTECESCGAALCEDCMMECNNGEMVCEDCLIECVLCGDWYCENCIVECEGCSETLCMDCAVECEACGSMFCVDCTFECSNGGFFCEDDLVECEGCGDLICEQCLCEDCESLGLNCGCHDEYWCYACDACIVREALECSGCGNFFCESDLYECDVCSNGFCEDCMCSDCGLLGLECGCHDEFFCSECGECSYDRMCEDGGDHCIDCCTICQDCGNCALEQGMELCDGCEMCEDCVENYHCSNCNECPENVDMCDQHSEPVCYDCAVDEGYHCPECETCYEYVSQCGEGGDHCEDCCLICDNCGDCALGKDVDFCDLCMFCEDCWEESHCSNCGECGEAVTCCDQHGDLICADCAIADGLHCPECEECYESVDPCAYDGEHCQNCCMCAGGGVDIDEANFPDGAFRAVISLYDLNNDKKLSDSEIKLVTTMKITSDKVKSLQGIEYFSYLRNLSALNATVNDLEGEWLPNSLQSLFLHLDKSIKSVDFYGKNALEVLTLADGGLTELNLAMLPKLTKLNCSGNEITSLDLKNVASTLTYLDCSNNQLACLDLSVLEKECQVNVSGNSRQLPSISCGYSLSMLDPTMDPSRVALLMGASYDSSSDVWVVSDAAEKINYVYKSNSKKITWLSKDSVYTIQFDKLVHGWAGTCSSSCSCGKETCSHSHYTNGVCDKCGMVKVDADNFPDEAWRQYISKNVDADENGLLCAAERESVTSIKMTKEKGIHNLKGVEFFVNLEELNLVDTLTSAVDLSSNTQLTSLKFKAGYSAALDLSNNKKLTALSITGVTVSEKDGKKTREVMKGITSIDLSKCTSLTTVYLNNNRLESLNLSAAHGLTVLECSNNLIEVLSIDGCHNLKTLKADGNCLMGMDLSDYKVLTNADLSNNVRVFDSIPNTFFLNHLNAAVSDVQVDEKSFLDKDLKTNKWVIDDETITSFTYVYSHNNKNVADETYTVKFGKIYNVDFNGVEDVEANVEEVIVYTDGLTIYVQNASSDVLVYSMLGNLVGSEAVRLPQTTIQVNVPSPGVYVLVSGNFSRRVLVKE